MQKISHRFLLRKDTDKKNRQSILWLINIDKRQYKISTGYHIVKESWDKEKQRLKGSSTHANHYNSELGTFQADADKMILRYHSMRHNVSIDDFKRIIKGMPQSDNFIQYCKDKTEQLKGVLAKGTIIRYNTKIRKLEKFNPNITFGYLDNTYLLSLLNFLKEEGNQQNTIYTMYKTLRTMVNHAIEDHLMESNPLPAFMHRYKIKAVEGKRDFLTKDELRLLEQIYAGNHKFSEKILSKTMNKNTLKWYLFCCYTSLRYSDLRSLKFKNIRENKGEYPGKFKYYIDKIAEKNSNNLPKRLLIPLVDKAIALLPEELDDNSDTAIWKVYTNQKVNESLKSIAEIAEINKRITFHTARHTFAMLSLNMDIPIEVIQELLGHTELSTTKIYAKMMAETSFRHMDAWQKL